MAGAPKVRAARLREVYIGDDGQPAIRLTLEGVRVARQLAMLGEDRQDALMAALLEEGGMRRPALAGRAYCFAAGLSGPASICYLRDDCSIKHRGGPSSGT